MSLKSRINRLEKRRPPIDPEKLRESMQALSDVNRDGNLRYPRPEPTPEELPKWAEWQRWRHSPEGIAAEVAQELERRREWERAHPGERPPRRPWQSCGLTDEALIELNMAEQDIRDAQEKREPPAQQSPAEPTEPPAAVLQLSQCGLKELSEEEYEE